MTSNFYLNCKSVSEVFRWYLTEERMSSLTAAAPCTYHGAAETDLISFAGNLSFEICRVGEQWSCLMKRAKYSNLILLLGAGGVVVYLLRKGRPQRRSPGGRPGSPGTSTSSYQRRKPRFQARSFWSWLLDEELVEDFSEDSYFLHSHYFGPAVSLSDNNNSGGVSGSEVDLDSEAEDVSLNCLTFNTSPKRFLKRPLFDIRERSRTRQYQTPIHIANPCPKCVKGTCRLKKHQMYLNTPSSGSSNYSGSPQTRANKQKTSTPEFEDDRSGYYLHGADSDQLPGFFRPGYDERMSGDGSDEMDPSNLTDQLNNLTGTPVGFLKDQYRPTYRLYGRSRGPPDGKERYSMSPVQHNSRCSSPGSVDLYHHQQQDSDQDQDNPSMSACSMSGSMLDLVQNAREVRRLIREASFDSTGSDLSLDFSLNGEIGVSTAEGLDTLCKGIHKLIDNCENIEEDISCIPDPKLTSSKSSMSGLSQYAATSGESAEEEGGGDLKRDGSIPDLRALQRSLRQNKGMWKLTDFSGLSDRSRQASIVSDSGSFEWDSPVHGWTESRPYRLPLAYSSNVSESGDEVCSFAGSGLDAWEWDDCYTLEVEGGASDPGVHCMSGHTSWLPDMSRELDLEAELRWRELSSGREFDRGHLSGRSSLDRGPPSSRSSIDRELLMHYRRLPPSGRSSVDRESRLSVSSAASSVSDDLTITGQMPAKHRSRTDLHRSRSGSRPSSPRGRNRSADSGLDMDRSLMDTSRTSLDTGLGSMDTSVSSISSSMFVSSINLSPVKEAGEPANSPLRQSELSGESDLSPMSTNSELCFGDITTTDTVIKVSVPLADRSTRGCVAKSLFAEDRTGEGRVEDELNENNVDLDVRLNNQSFN